MSEFKVLEPQFILDSKKNHMVTRQCLKWWEQLSRRYPRKGEFGQPTYRCRWCGIEVDHSPDVFLIGNFCSFSCHAAHGANLYVCLSIMFASFAILTLDAVLTYGLMMNSLVIILPVSFGLLTVWSLAGVFYGKKLRKETPRQYLHREKYDSRIRA